jgi:hypothetical protein
MHQAAFDNTELELLWNSFRRLLASCRIAELSDEADTGVDGSAGGVARGAAK